MSVLRKQTAQMKRGNLRRKILRKFVRDCDSDAEERDIPGTMSRLKYTEVPASSLLIVLPICLPGKVSKDVNISL